MKVQLKILHQPKGDLFVEAYEIKDNVRTMCGHFCGTIEDIRLEIEKRYDTSVEIEPSMFQGWY